MDVRDQLLTAAFEAATLHGIARLSMAEVAQRAGLFGIQEWLSFYYKAPMVAPGLHAEHDLFVQQSKLENTLRWMMDEDQITHLGREYYDET